MISACPVCDSPTKINDDPVLAIKRIGCDKCGTYSISYNFFSQLPDEQHWNQVKPKLSLALQWASNRGSPAVLGGGEDVMAAIASYEGHQQSIEEFKGKHLAVYIDGDQAWIYKAFPPVDPGPKWRLLTESGGPYQLPLPKSELARPSSSMNLAVHDYETETGRPDLRDRLTRIKAE